MSKPKALPTPCEILQSHENRTEIAREGAISPLAALVRGGSDNQKEHAVRALESLAHDSYDNRATIARAQAIPVLIELLESESDTIKRCVATLLASLSRVESSLEEIVQHQGIPPLIAHLEAEQKATGSFRSRRWLLQTGTDGQKRHAARSWADELAILMAELRFVLAMLFHTSLPYYNEGEQTSTSVWRCLHC
jgi:hypothetical protein